MSIRGKKVGKFKVSTVLAEYDLDVRLDLEGNTFIILVPDNPGTAVNTKGYDRNYESFSATLLEDVKEEVRAHLKSRDKTAFVDVIEYNYSGSKEAAHWGSAQNTVGFDFRVARVAVAQDRNGRPKLEVPIDVDAEGNVAVSRWNGEKEECSPQAYRHKHDSRIVFTIERWRKCCAIRDGIAKLDKMLFELLGADGAEAAAKLDAVGGNPLLAAVPEKGESI